jgi:hypothetical protein
LSKIKRLEQRLQQHYTPDTQKNCPDTKKMIAEVCSTLTSSDDIHSLISSLLTEKIKSETEKLAISKPEIDTFARFISEQIKLYSTKLKSGSKAVRYNQEII